MSSLSFLRRILLLTSLLSFPALAQQQPTRPPITGIAFARFYTTDPAAAQKFYGSTLGYERKEANDMWIYPVNHSQWIEILTAPPPPQPNVRLAAVAFTTDNVVQLQQYLEAHGVKSDVPLKNGQFGVRDPEGNLVIFVQRNSEKLVARSLGSPSATSTRIIHVGFIVTDRAKEDAFWQQILGFRPYWHGGPKDDGVDNWVSLQVPDGSDWLEDTWAGRALRIGDAVIGVRVPCTRCTMVTRPQPGLDRDLDIYRVLARQHRATFGVWSDVQSPGTIRAGDTAELVG